MAENRLRVVIIGGGIAGALAGRVLREYHTVTILERSSDAYEVGAAINIGPNGARILATLGFDTRKVGCLEAGMTRTWNKEGKILQEDLKDFIKEYGAPWLFQHRADLRQEFLRLATEDSESLGVKGNAATLRYDAKVVDVDVDAGTVYLDSGEKIEADLVVGADGIKSIIRPLVVGDQAFATARPSGLSAFRFTLPRSDVLDIFPDLPVLDRNRPATLEMVFSFDPSNRSAVMYPCRNFELLNLVCIVPDSHLKTVSTESWSAPGDLEELLECFSDFPKWFLDIVALGKNIKLWQLRDQDPLPSYAKGRTILIGDAAHAMTPHQGQGGTQAVEDAEAFRLFNVDNVSRANVAEILKDFDAVRRPRASQIQNNTRKAVNRRTPEEVDSFAKYNWTYPGVVEGLRRVKAGEQLIQFS